MLPELSLRTGRALEILGVSRGRQGVMQLLWQDSAAVGGVDAWGNFADGLPKSTGEGEPGCVERLLHSGGGRMQ